MMASLQSELAPVEATLCKVLEAIAAGVKDVSDILRRASTEETGTSNQLGDQQLVADIEADAQILKSLKACGAVAVASSEEQPQDLPLAAGGSYSVAYDPLDGSSIVAANWSVGAIFGVWPGSGFVGRTGRDMVAAAYAVFGPRTVLVLARPQSGASAALQKDLIVQEFTLHGDCWVLSKGNVTIAHEKKIFAPANLRAAQENAAYGDLMAHWMAQRYTLRYSGGMVPDVHHILVKGGGIFCNPKSPSSPAKLRVLYETLPLAFVVEAAGGASYDGQGSALDRSLRAHDDRSIVCMGSKAEVAKCVTVMSTTQ